MEAGVVRRSADCVSDPRGVDVRGRGGEPGCGAGDGVGVEELISGLGQTRLGDAPRERGQRGPESGERSIQTRHVLAGAVLQASREPGCLKPT